MLLAWAEGELPWWQALRVRRHVRSCWQCRGEVNELERLVAEVGITVGQMPEPSKTDVTKAWWRFRATVRERYPDGTPELRALPWLNWSRVAAASALLGTAALAYVVNAPLFRRDGGNSSAAAMKGTIRREFTPPPTGSTQPVTRPDAANPTPPKVDLSSGAVTRHLSSPPEEELVEAEVHALEALHRSGLCRTSGVSVRRAGDAVEVSGMARSRAQQLEIETLLTGISAPGVMRVNVRAPEELAELSTGEATSTTERADAEPAKSTPPVVKWMRESLHGRAGLTERDLFNLMNSMALASERASSEAWAVRRIAEQFPESRTRSLRTDLQTAVLRMVEDHTTLLERELASLHSKLSTISPGTASATPERALAEPWQSGALALQQQVEDLVRQFLGSFSATGSDTPLSSMNQRTSACASLAGLLRIDLQTRTAALRPASRLGVE